ncbi:MULTISPECIES: high light inducible protein [unclassified Prochlorococcus]|uniref:high light inducible protein n=1 Tax=unclassified Prochlorococcus TaxID=2627481 RepID=UPI0005338688|nr:MULTISPECIES: high light inducible protein [unclassified Prochlorococcus]KGG16489.1 putative high light inducible protein [Prochlorococcus sp. MIT 0602]KGG17036.1 putative high light inducible protein [Prochlorococcus sp. MIT 0603]
MNSSEKDKEKAASPVSKTELNSWKRGFTPQAEIWNGRMASIGLIIGLFSLILINNLFGGK